MCVSACFPAFPSLPHLPLQDVEAEFAGRPPDMIEQEFQRRVNATFKGMVVLCLYNHKVHRIECVDWTKDSNSTFPYKRRGPDRAQAEEVQISFREYFGKVYSVTASDPPRRGLLQASQRRRGPQQDVSC